MMKPLHYVALALVVVAAIAAVVYFDKNPAEPEPSGSPAPSGRACTLEAKLCPDGSAVGRVGPNCEFAPCPSAMPSSPPPNRY